MERAVGGAEGQTDLVGDVGSEVDGGRWVGRRARLTLLGTLAQR